MRAETIVWQIVAAIGGFVVAWITIVNFVIEPMEARMERARINIQHAVEERDTRLDYLQRQIDELERIVPRRPGSP